MTDAPAPQARLRPFNAAVEQVLTAQLGAFAAHRLILRATAEQALARAFWCTQTFFPRGA